MARARLTIAGETGVALLLLFLMIVLYLWADGARRDAQAAREASELRQVQLQEQIDCSNGLQAQALDALVQYIVALQAGEGAAVAQVDAQMAAGRFLDARERCAAE